MLTLEVVKCSDQRHKIECLKQAFVASERTVQGPEVRNGRKVTIRGAITDPCTCHVDALLWIIKEMRAHGLASSDTPWVAFEATYMLATHGEML